MTSEIKQKNHVSSFGRLITDLVNSINEQNIISEEEINDILVDCDMEHDSKVPDWLFHFFKSLLNRNLVERIHFKYSQENTGDVYCFLVELESILEGDWDNYGEDIKIIFPRLKIKAYVSFESQAYYIMAV